MGKMRPGGTVNRGVDSPISGLGGGGKERKIKVGVNEGKGSKKGKVYAMN